MFLRRKSGRDLHLRVRGGRFAVSDKVALEVAEGVADSNVRGRPRVELHGGSLWVDPVAVGELRPRVAKAWRRWELLTRRSGVKRRATDRNTSGWQRPEQDKDQRSPAQRWRDYKERRKRGPYTARFAKPLSRVPLSINEAWARLEGWLKRAV